MRAPLSYFRILFRFVCILLFHFNESSSSPPFWLQIHLTTLFPKETSLAVLDRACGEGTLPVWPSRADPISTPADPSSPSRTPSHMRPTTRAWKKPRTQKIDALYSIKSFLLHSMRWPNCLVHCNEYIVPNTARRFFWVIIRFRPRSTNT